MCNTLLSAGGRGGGFSGSFFGLAEGVGGTGLFLLFESFIESVSASSHESILLPLAARSAAVRQDSQHPGHFLYY
jgi:hypothetical protein